VLTLAFEKNIEMRLFNLLPGSRSLADAEMDELRRQWTASSGTHNKMFVADNAKHHGGRNLGETYFGQRAQVPILLICRHAGRRPHARFILKL
jgi:phosphatidylserine/phosphatidylglycerophosphate/cardiolipin synthase-like enzyme